MTFDRLLFLFGIGFLAANLLVVAQSVRTRARRVRALLVWPPPPPPLAPLFLLIGLILVLLILYNVVTGQARLPQVFGEGMMAVYYLGAVRLKALVRPGIYTDGIWTDSGFMPWSRIDAVSWREKPKVTLLVVSRRRSLARRLTVPGALYGQVRRVLRELAASHDLTLSGTGLTLGLHDGAEDI